MRRNEPAELITLFVIFILTMTAFSMISGCASQVRTNRPVVEQLIFFRDSATGLGSNRICAKKDWLGKCEEWSVKSYDLRDSETRKSLIDLGFVCHIAGKRYKIDPDQAGFARYQEIKKCFFCKSRTEIVDRISIDNTRYIVDAGTYCYTESEHSGGIVDMDL